MKYERPAIERRVKATNPVITVTTPTSPIALGLTWNHPNNPGGDGDTARG